MVLLRVSDAQLWRFLDYWVNTYLTKELLININTGIDYMRWLQCIFVFNAAMVLHWEHQVRIRHVATHLYLRVSEDGRVGLTPDGRDPRTVFRFYAVMEVGYLQCSGCTCGLTYWVWIEIVAEIYTTPLVADVLMSSSCYQLYQC